MLFLFSVQIGAGLEGQEMTGLFLTFASELLNDLQQFV